LDWPQPAEEPEPAALHSSRPSILQAEHETGCQDRVKQETQRAQARQKSREEVRMETHHMRKGEHCLKNLQAGWRWL
jgi:hypothetical protein